MILVNRQLWLRRERDISIYIYIYIYVYNTLMCLKLSSKARDLQKGLCPPPAAREEYAGEQISKPQNMSDL